jgi:hypothetical protein
MERGGMTRSIRYARPLLVLVVVMNADAVTLPVVDKALINALIVGMLPAAYPLICCPDGVSLERIAKISGVVDLVRVKDFGFRVLGFTGF